MRRLSVIASVTIILAIMISACQQQGDQVIESRWAGETVQEAVHGFENQFGGFDQTMMETNYRYNELYWAGVDENWGYAEYQLDEMLGNIEKGFIRRPERQPSSVQFVDQAAPRLMRAIKAGDKDAFMESFNRFAISCNTCHAMEDVAFIQVIVPENRTTLVRF